MGNYVLAPGVENELDGIWEYIAKDNPDAATRVVRAAYESFRALAANPGLGHPRTFRRKALRNIRLWNVVGFRKYLIFYREVAGGIEVLHIFHDARNIQALM